MATADTELIRDYAAEGSQRAFAALVARHVDLVYSAALRQVQSPQLAEEVTQTVFVTLARHAQTLKPGTPLVAWLYLVTRRAAIDLLRTESRRQAREHIAVELADMNSTPSDWSRVEPLLDEAMETLNETDRGAILLRFFEDKSLREIGATLGTSEDAAQKRVSRALEQLRAFFSKRGVSVGAASLATSLTAHAVHAAPIGLGLSISSTAALGGAALQVAAFATTKTIAMTTLQKTMVATAFAAAVGVGIYEQRVIARQQEQLGASAQQLESIRTEMRQLRQERDAATTRWAAMQREIDAAQASLARGERAGAPEPIIDSELKAAQRRVTELKRRLAEMAGSRARAAAGLLTNEDWIRIALQHKLESKDDIEAALADLQNNVTLKWTESIDGALKRFAAAHEGLLPTDCAQLAPFLPPGSDPSMLARFQMLRAGKLSEAPGEVWLVADTGPADDETGTLVMFGRGNTITGGNKERRAIVRAFAEFVRANQGVGPTDVAQLQPYLRQPVEARELRDFWRQHGHQLR